MANTIELFDDQPRKLPSVRLPACNENHQACDSKRDGKLVPSHGAPQHKVDDYWSRSGGDWFNGIGSKRLTPARPGHAVQFNGDTFTQEGHQ
jgi:hypothetical protein